jgi:hypothetical protein
MNTAAMADEGNKTRQLFPVDMVREHPMHAVERRFHAPTITSALDNRLPE